MNDENFCKMILEENKKLKAAGNLLSIASLRVATEYDGVHRLMLAVSEWTKAIADEGGRGEQIEPTLEVQNKPIGLPHELFVWCINEGMPEGIKTPDQIKWLKTHVKRLHTKIQNLLPMK